MSWKCACGQPCDSVSKALLRTLRTAHLDLGGEHVQSEHLIQWWTPAQDKIAIP